MPRRTRSIWWSIWRMRPTTTRCVSPGCRLAREDGGDRVIGEETIRSGSGKILFSATHPQQQWPVGNYRVEVYLNGTQTHTVPFTVQF